MTAMVITIIIIVIGREIKINFNDPVRLNGASLRRGVRTEAQVELMTLTRVDLALLMTHGDVADVISHTDASEPRGVVNDPHERRVGWGGGVGLRDHLDLFPKNKEFRRFKGDVALD